MEDGDEPYSPGGSDEELPYTSIISKPSLPPATVTQTKTEQDEIQRKMDELNRQIEAQEMEIAILNTKITVGDGPGESSSGTTSSTSIAPGLANISIPSNLVEILKSIKNSSNPADVGMDGSTAMASTSSYDLVDEEEYTPTAPSSLSFPLDSGYVPTTLIPQTQGPSKLAQLTDEELLRMVPDDLIEPPPPKKSKY